MAHIARALSLQQSITIIIDDYDLGKVVQNVGVWELEIYLQLVNSESLITQRLLIYTVH